ncbi:MAG: discoidin domain-containing protein, partial [Mangrovibacterium sp.]
KDGLMHSDTRFGDYPRYAPAIPGKKGAFRGWMLLSYNKPSKASSAVGEHSAKNLTDENVKSFWLADANNAKQWVEIDLQTVQKVCAIQVNYFDYKSTLYGKIPGLRHRYRVIGSADGTNWIPLVNRSASFKDTPNDYLEVASPQMVRYVRYENISVPTPNLAISDIRVFGQGSGKSPAKVKKLVLNRHRDQRDISVFWSPVPGAQGYNLLWGIAPDKLYSSWMVYDQNELTMKNLTVGQSYYFAVEAFSENGVSEISEIIKVE